MEQGLVAKRRLNDLQKNFSKASDDLMDQRTNDSSIGSFIMSHTDLSNPSSGGQTNHGQNNDSKRRRSTLQFRKPYLGSDESNNSTMKTNKLLLDNKNQNTTNLLSPNMARFGRFAMATGKFHYPLSPLSNRGFRRSRSSSKSFFKNLNLSRRSSINPNDNDTGKSEKDSEDNKRRRMKYASESIDETRRLSRSKSKNWFKVREKATTNTTNNNKESVRKVRSFAPIITNLLNLNDRPKSAFDQTNPLRPASQTRKPSFDYNMRNKAMAQSTVNTWAQTATISPQTLDQPLASYLEDEDVMDMEYGYGQDFGSAEPEMDQDAYMREAAIDEDMDD